MLSHIDHLRPDRKSLLGVAALFVCALLWAVPPVWGQSAKSEIIVIDGDTLEIDGEVFRLYGIDAPELGQTCLQKSKRWRCGLHAAIEMRGLVTNWGNIVCGTIQVEGEGTRAICHNAQYTDPAEVLLRRGLAVALPNTVPAYKRAEFEARNAKLGIWRGEFVEPSRWRKGERLTGPPDSAAEVCEIKGIITDQGNRVYYVTTDKGYDEIAVAADRGERMFCSDDAAELAGWKRYPRD